jgi:hypothetical protein
MAAFKLVDSGYCRAKHLRRQDADVTIKVFVELRVIEPQETQKQSSRPKRDSDEKISDLLGALGVVSASGEGT